MKATTTPKERQNLNLATSKCIGLNLVEEASASSSSSNTTKKGTLSAMLSTFTLRNRATSVVMLTTFVFELRVGILQWTVKRTSRDLRRLHEEMSHDFALFRLEDFLNDLDEAIFRVTDSCETMAVVESKEGGELFLAKALQYVDFITYLPLGLFVDLQTFLKLSYAPATVLQRAFRRYSLRKRRMRLVYKYYSNDLERLITILERGIEVFCFPSSKHQFKQLSSSLGLHESQLNEQSSGPDPPGMVSQILWLEIEEKFLGRSRLCVAPKKVFNFELGGAQGDWEKEMERISVGVSLVDIAEVRLGAASDGFRKASATNECHYDPKLCFSVIAGERTHDIHLPAERIRIPPPRDSFDSSLKRTVSSSSSTPPMFSFVRRPSAQPSMRQSLTRLFTNSFRSSTASEDDIDLNDSDRNETVSRDWLVNMISLLSMKFLSPGETTLRNRVYRPAHLLRDIGFMTSRRRLFTALDLKEAKKMKTLLIGYLNIDEEPFRGTYGRTVPRVFWYCEPLGRLYIGPCGDGGISGFDFTQPDAEFRCIDLVDIAEIRPGKYSVEMDGNDTRPRVTIVGSEQRICLPITKKDRDKLLRKLQRFVSVYAERETRAEMPLLHRNTERTLKEDIINVLGYTQDDAENC